MNILGIFFMGSDPAAALLQSGKLVAVAEEERFVREKHAIGYFPLKTIKFCLDYANLSLEDIDYISVGWGAYKYPNYMKKIYRKIEREYPTKDKTTKKWEVRTLKEHNESALSNKIKSQFQNVGFKNIPDIKFVSHHLAHAASAYYCSGFKKASILTIDGHGDENCTVEWIGEDDKITKLFQYTIPNSLGWFYSAFTEFLGFKHKDGEGKVMGLAPYGKYNDKIANYMDQIVQGDNKGYKVDPSYIFYELHSYNPRYTNKLVKMFGKPRKSDEEITMWHKDIAYGVQRKLEECISHLIQKLIDENSCKKICIAGGVGLNCKMNGYIRNEGIDDIFIQPMSGDSGTAIGSALALYKEMIGKSPSFKMKDVYLGPEYGITKIEEALSREKLNYEYYDYSEITKVSAELISQGKIIGWFQGRMECGPRALGSRSIIADPRDPTMRDKVNKIKGREKWRPLALSILAEKAEEYLFNAYPSPFMTLSFRVKKGLIAISCG